MTTQSLRRLLLAALCLSSMTTAAEDSAPAAISFNVVP